LQKSADKIKEHLEKSKFNGVIAHLIPDLYLSFLWVQKDNTDSGSGENKNKDVIALVHSYGGQ